VITSAVRLPPGFVHARSISEDETFVAVRLVGALGRVALIEAEVGVENGPDPPLVFAATSIHAECPANTIPQR